MTQSAIATIILILTGLTTWQGLRNATYRDKYIFDVDAILKGQERYRLFSSGFLHIGWLHYAFNMIALLSFATRLEWEYGRLPLLGLYALSLLGGSLYALYVHRNHGDYRALGASGAVSGVVGASILAYPNSSIGLILIPIEFTAWIFGLAYILITIFGLKRQMGNIGHSAHLGGTITGMLLVLAWDNDIINRHPLISLALLGPAILFSILIVRNPNVLILDRYWGETAHKLTNRKEPTIDEVLEKIKHK
ncbi:MAG: rhomboid family intramembrane serine protease, partial [Bacteroidota bacterium]